MLHHRIGRLVTGSFLGLLLGSAGTLAAGSPALAQTASPAQTSGTAPATIASCQYTSDTVHSYSYCSTGQSATITVPPSGNVVYTFNYPGDNSNITFTASVTPIDPTTASAIGVNVFDNTKPSTPPTPAEIVTIQTNELNSDPHMMQFNYSSGTAGPVTLQLFNYSSGTVTFSLNDSGLVFQTGSGAAVTPVTLQLKSGATSAPAGSAPVSPGASPAPGQPTAQASGDPSSIQSCQYTSDQFHSYPFCSTGQFTPVNVPANGSVVYKFNYPGDNSDIT
ncbi:MAG TPA: hypothetical protein VKU60_00595, partial [Chloroflexota bacterium]|nr:hypothetical protein [Chloroflexota bacterium]